MKKEYVICAKAKKDNVFAKIGEYMFASIDDGRCGTGFPCWGGEWDCKKFMSIESAEKWFNEHVSFLIDFGTEIDMDSIVILSRQYVYNKEKQLLMKEV